VAKLALVPGTVAGHPDQEALGLAGRTNGPEFDGAGFSHELSFDGPVKSPSVPLGAGLRFNFVVAAYLARTLHSSVLARLASGAFYETIALVIYYPFQNYHDSKRLATMTTCRLPKGRNN
jgi:hypothetical protein